MEFVDRQISCLDCSQPFTFTAGEQEFYSRKGFKEEPKRCKPCRELRKNGRDRPAGQDAGGGGGRPARNGNGGGGGGGIGISDGSSILGSRPLADPESDAGAGAGVGNARSNAAFVDDDIGNRMPGAAPGPRGPREVREVRPNRQRSNRTQGQAQAQTPGPVRNGGSGPSNNAGATGGGHGGGGGGREPREARELYDAVCAQCGVTARVPFKPVAGRPVYCRDCYGNRG